MRKALLLTTVCMLVLVLSVIPIQANAKKGKLIHQFQRTSPKEAVADMGAGWNLGNTLDAIPTEGSWNNAPVEEQTFDSIKAAGFESVRIPVTWTHHIGEGPDYQVDEQWMNRVEQVVDWALERDLYVVLNVHHDSWEWASMEEVEGREEKKQKLEKLWKQIANEFKNRSDKLMFEVLNEPAGEGTDEELADIAAQYNDINERVLKVIRDTGGHNKKRLVLLPGLWTNIDHTISYFEAPDDPNIILTVHNYDPWDFVSNWWGRTNWGTEEDIQHFDNLFKRLHDKFVAKGLPVIIGEYGTLASNEPHSKWLYHDTFVSTAHKYGMATMWWDNGNDHFDRVNQVWRDPIVKDIIINASKGIANSMVNKASIYIENNEEIIDEYLQLNLRGNQLVSIKSEQRLLSEGSDYQLNGDEVILTSEYLTSIVEGFGVNETLTFNFSSGADQEVSIIEYATPEFEQTAVTINGKATEDLKIPVDFNGTTLATVKAMEIENGEETVPVKDEWTMSMPEPQQGRINQFDDFWSDDQFVYISKSVLNQVDQDTASFTFEFWPRERNVNVNVNVQFER